MTLGNSGDDCAGSETAAASAVKAYEELAMPTPANPMEYDTGTERPAKRVTKARPNRRASAFKSPVSSWIAIRRSSTPGYSVDRRLTEMKAINAA